MDDRSDLAFICHFKGVTEAGGVAVLVSVLCGTDTVGLVEGLLAVSVHYRHGGEHEGRHRRRDVT